MATSKERALDLSRQLTAAKKDVAFLGSYELTFFLLDMSSSMYDFLGTVDGKAVYKDACLKSGFEAIMHARMDHQEDTGDEVGVIAFSSHNGDPRIVVIQDAGDASEELIESVKNLTPHGSTPMAQAIEELSKVVRRAGAGMVKCVIMSDGDPDNPDLAKEYLKLLVEEESILVDTVFIGPESGVRGKAFLKAAAEIGGGEYFEASTPGLLNQKLISAERERRLLVGKGILLLPDLTQ